MQPHLSQILIEKFGLTEENIEEVLSLQKEKGGDLGDILIKKNMLSEMMFLEALSMLYHIPFEPQLSAENINTDFNKVLN